MRCSLLTLSSFLDDEVGSDRRSEVDAHLVGCQRCRNGVGYLEEEVARIGALARVHVPDQGVYTLMQQLGLIGPEELLPARNTPAVALHRDDTPPWLRGGSSRAALPWVPPSKADDAAAERNQPALPFSDVPLHQMSSRTSPAAPPPSLVPEAHNTDDDTDDDTETEVELDGRAFHDAAPVTESRSGFVPRPQAAAIPYAEAGHKAAPEVAGLEGLRQSPPLPGGFVEADRGGLSPEPIGDISAPPPPAAAEAAAPALPVDPEPELTPAAIEPADWRAWLPDTPEPSAAVPAPTDWAPQAVPPPPPLAPPPAAAAPEPSPSPPPRIEDLDDDAWNWAPRDHEQPRRGGAASSPEPPGQDWHSDPSAPEPADADADPLIDPLIARAAGPPRPMRSSAISRVRDQIALRLALARRRGRGDDEVQIVSGHGAPERSVPQRRTSRRIRPEDERQTAPRAIESGGPIIAAARSQQGYAAPDRRDEASPSGTRFDPASTRDRLAAAPLAGFPDDAMRGSGRHTRGLSFRRSPLANPQLRRAGENLAAFATTMVERGRTVIAHPRQRWIAAGAVIALLLVIFLSFHRSSESPSVASAPPQATAAGSSSAAASAPPRSTPAGSGRATPAATAPPAVAPALPKTQTYGDGGQGWQIQKLRYGIHPGDYRIVFDLAAAGAGASGSPTVAISFTDPQTMLVTYSGVVPPGSAGTPAAGGVITGVTQTKGASGQVVFKFSLAHPVTVAGQYLRNPLRLVIDLKS